MRPACVTGDQLEINSEDYTMETILQPKNPAIVVAFSEKEIPPSTTPAPETTENPSDPPQLQLSASALPQPSSAPDSEAQEHAGVPDVVKLSLATLGGQEKDPPSLKEQWKNVRFLPAAKLVVLSRSTSPSGRWRGSRRCR